MNAKESVVVMTSLNSTTSVGTGASAAGSAHLFAFRGSRLFAAARQSKALKKFIYFQAGGPELQDRRCPGQEHGMESEEEMPPAAAVALIEAAHFPAIRRTAGEYRA